jgi:hypothetical protein
MGGPKAPKKVLKTNFLKLKAYGFWHKANHFSSPGIFFMKKISQALT